MALQPTLRFRARLVKPISIPRPRLAWCHVRFRVRLKRRGMRESINARLFRSGENQARPLEKRRRIGRITVQAQGNLKANPARFGNTLTLSPGTGKTVAGTSPGPATIPSSKRLFDKEGSAPKRPLPIVGCLRNSRRHRLAKNRTPKSDGQGSETHLPSMAIGSQYSRSRLLPSSCRHEANRAAGGRTGRHRDMNVSKTVPLLRRGLLQGRVRQSSGIADRAEVKHRSGLGLLIRYRQQREQKFRDSIGFFQMRIT